MHSSTFSYGQSNLHTTQPTYSLLCSPSRPQVVCNRRVFSGSTHTTTRAWRSISGNGMETSNGMEMEAIKGNG